MYIWKDGNCFSRCSMQLCKDRTDRKVPILFSRCRWGWGGRHLALECGQELVSLGGPEHVIFIWIYLHFCIHMYIYLLAFQSWSHCNKLRCFLLSSCNCVRCGGHPSPGSAPLTLCSHPGLATGCHIYHRNLLPWAGKKQIYYIRSVLTHSDETEKREMFSTMSLTLRSRMSTVD